MNITKQIETPEGLITEYENKHSIELGQTAKGEWYVKSIKVYANSVYEMLELSIDIAEKAQDIINKSGVLNDQPPATETRCESEG